MSEPLRVNLSGIQAQQAKQEARQTVARQVASKARFTEEVEEGFNPAASRKEMERRGRFRSLESRKKAGTQEAIAIKEVEARAEEDLAHDFERRNPELPADKLATLKGLIHEEQTAEDILAEVLKMFSDPTLADEALDFLDRSLLEPIKSRVKKARELLNEKLGREVLAGRNIDTAAKSFAKKGVKTPSELRNLYREVTGDPKPHNALFAQLSAEYDFDELQSLVEFLLQGMAYDLKSKGPSIQPAELQLLMTEVRNLQSIVWVYLFFKERLKMIRAQYK
ncbi:MAG: type III secretion system gatekeeper subunit SctW, partial [Chlamydiae bacterium]|nr:type III secretion system gatekeeper subunit SctW [Chlamydiota bacterium]